MTGCESEDGCPGHLKQVGCRTALCPASGRFFDLLVVQGGQAGVVWMASSWRVEHNGDIDFINVSEWCSPLA